MQVLENFDWDVLEAQNKKTINNKIRKIYPESCVYSHEKYALEMYEKLMGIEISKKDFTNGDIFRITDISSINNNTISFILENGIYVEVDMNKEKKYCDIHNQTPEGFCNWIKLNKNEYLKYKPNIMLLNSIDDIKGDLYNAHINKVKEEFSNQIINCEFGYVAKVIEKNRGGFIVNVMGVEGFLPGGLAAANKIIDFDSYIGQEIIVMVEDFLKQTQTYVFSNKKYLAKVLPTKMRELSLTEEIVGTVTGTSKFGIFIEFNEIFTGLLHISKMNTNTKELFEHRQIHPGDDINFWVKEITNDNRIILSQEDPILKQKELDIFLLKHKDDYIHGKIIKNMQYGSLVKLDENFIGLLQTKPYQYKIDDEVLVKIDSFKNDKIFLKLINEN